MTRSELVVTIANRFPKLTAADVDYSVRLILDQMAKTIVDGGRVEIRGFGSFDIRYRPAKIGRNPKTGEPVMIAEKYVPHFKVGKEMRERVM